ncbi:hypothetical protein IQ22_02551 [Pseudomonas duriflava]|uniref:Secreted protein n=1 Tax=Pseudomonas duriflava TaxID=459528 RepID=A0A562Q992_9PSED|nr:hypothetical protein [Pseudomonas duriflava]TWI53337.1 hypothetical protein IQ22_02551 [Pseudomonas duriflava]
MKPIKRRCLRLAALVGALLISNSLLVTAAPAPFFKWRSTLDGQVVCRQVSPGSAWERIAGPFRDLQCHELGSQPMQRWDRIPAPSRS